ncbi:MAG TPA: BREX protein BrxB domain-containing protein [Archangium sp.]|nr:BREX protein BrxB domain-containing protein [Archangium sp.]
MTNDLFSLEGVDGAVAALERDLTAPTGPRISTMRNHNFAILVYPPRKEFHLRQRLRTMIGRLESEGWAVLSMALHQVLFERLRTQLGAEELQALVERERRLYARSPERAMNDLRQRLAEHIDGSEGLATDIEQRITAFRAQSPVDPDRTLVLVGRTGALYPFFRSSALLKHLGGRTSNVPVVLLYPGEQREGGLSFMQELEPDRDYRPRIYA